MSNEMKEYIQDIQNEIMYAKALFYEAYPEAKECNILQDENVDYYVLFSKVNEEPIGAIFDRGSYTLARLEPVIW